MIDPRLLRENPDLIRAAQAKRGLSGDVVDVALAADEQSARFDRRFEGLRNEQKTLGKQIPQAQGDEKPTLLARTKVLAAEVKAAEARQGEAEEAYRRAIEVIPNLAAADAPAGGEDDFVVLETVGTPRDFAAEGFEPRDHVELGQLLGAIDIERGAKVSGARFYYLTGVGADLEFALINLAMDQARSAGFTTVIPPALVKPRAMEGTGFLGQAADDVYRIEGEDLYLVGTVGGAAGGVPLRRDPRRRRAAAALRGVQPVLPQGGRLLRQGHPRASSGCTGSTRSRCSRTRPSRSRTPSTSGCWTGRRSSSTKLELAYRVIDVAAGDLGLSAQRKFDCEAWIPTQGKYRELTSTSNCTDFQARRLDIRGRLPPRAASTPVATLNGTLCAMTRTIVAILETHQQADGSVRVPEALRPYLQGRDVLEADDQRRAGSARRTGRPALVALDIDGTLLNPDFEAVTARQTPRVARPPSMPRRRGCARRAGHRTCAVRHARRGRPARPDPPVGSYRRGSPSPPTAR